MRQAVSDELDALLGRSGSLPANQSFQMTIADLHDKSHAERIRIKIPAVHEALEAHVVEAVPSRPATRGSSAP